jgi:hypothetical protein
LLYGGIKKLPDGSIVHIGMKGEDATPKGQARTRHLFHKNTDAPDTQVSEVESATPLQSESLTIER